MSANSKIEWTDHTFNPWEGCQKVGPGCDNCYAETRNARFGGGQAVNWGAGAPRRRTSESNWNLPKRWNAQADAFFALHGRRQRVFCASLADVFDNAVPVQWRIELVKLIMSTPNLDWLLLTKRIGNAVEMLETAFRGHTAQREGWRDNVPANVWIGATIVNQAEADRDIPKLLAVPAAKRFLGMEPLLGPVAIWKFTKVHCERHPGKLDTDGKCEVCEGRGIWGLGDDVLSEDEKAPIRPGIDWVIVGGESGPKARPMHPDWARHLRYECEAEEVPFLFKQWGEWIEPDVDGMPVRLTAREGDPEFFDAAASMDGFLCSDGRFAGTIYDFIEDVRYLGMRKVGKKIAGRLLDGRTWDGVPS